MKILQSSLLRWHIAGFFFVAIVGTLFHFTYVWSGYNPFVGMVSAVNESVWEHLKLGFFPVIVFGIVEFLFLDVRKKSFFFAKAVGVFVLMVFIVGFFYLYTAITGSDILLVDIISFYVAVALCQLVSYFILLRVPKRLIRTVAGILFFIVFTILFIVWTFLPPRIFLFEEESTGQYGTTWDKSQEVLEDGHD